jgi:hypothetical protein
MRRDVGYSEIKDKSKKIKGKKHGAWRMEHSAKS